jgi:hypothetical protein
MDFQPMNFQPIGSQVINYEPFSSKSKNFKKVGTIFLVFLCLCVIVGIIIWKSTSVSTVSGPAVLAKMRASIDISSIPPIDAKPWCYDTTYSFTVSGSSSKPTDVLVTKNLTKTFPVIQLTQTDGSPLKDGETINVTKTVYPQGFALLPQINTKSNYNNVIKGNTKDKNANKCELTKDGLFIDYDNACPLDFNLGNTEKVTGPGFITPYISIINDATFIDANAVTKFLPVFYQITFFSKNGASGQSIKAFYTPSTIYKPAFNIFTMYGIDGLRIERLDPSGTKVLKEQNKPAISTVTLSGTGASYVLKDNEPLGVQQSPIKATFNSFNSSFI